MNKLGIISSSKANYTKTQPNSYVTDKIVSTLDITEGTADPTSELDSHANMIVLGQHAFIFESTGRTCNVQPFSPDLGIATNIPIVDGAIAYDCPYTCQTYILIARNALYIKSMQHNLLPPFIMRAGGVTVNDTAKIHCNDPSINDHCVSFPGSNLRIPLHLKGTFSYFHTRLPTVEELHGCDKCFITPDSSDWNPSCTSFENNERAMLTYDGELTSSHRRTSLPMEIEHEADELFEIAAVSLEAWDTHIDTSISESHSELNHENNDNPSEADDFSAALSMMGEASKFGASIGSCAISDNKIDNLFTTPTITTTDKLESMLESMIDDSQMKEVKSVISAINASSSKGPTPEFLSKLWLVSEKLAKGAIESNTQLCRHNSDNVLSRQFSTNDRMLRYKRLQSAFFTDTMFATPKAKSKRGYTCCQVFVSDKGFVAVYPMASQEEFKTALHWFCKQVGVPVDLIVDGHKAQTSKDVRRFCNQIGTTLRILERNTPWANRAELYIGLLKEAV